MANVWNNEYVQIYTDNKNIMQKLTIEMCDMVEIGEEQVKFGRKNK